MMRPLHWTTALAALALIGVAHGAPVGCPPLLHGVGVTAAPAGWKALAPAPARLAEGGLMRGDPERQAYLRGDDRKVRNGITSVSKFEAGEEKWLWCGYGATSALQIAKRLPDVATSCTVTRLEHGLTLDISANCR
jgi:hypothetical protein